jgi:hypothetical protein
VCFSENESSNEAGSSHRKDRCGVDGEDLHRRVRIRRETGWLVGWFSIEEEEERHVSLRLKPLSIQWFAALFLTREEIGKDLRWRVLHPRAQEERRVNEQLVLFFNE